MYIQLYNILLRKKNINGRCRIHLKRGAEGRVGGLVAQMPPSFLKTPLQRFIMDPRASLSSVILYIAIWFPEIEIRNAANLLGKVDLGAVELGLEVVNVSAEEDEGYGEDANENGGGLALGGRSLDDDAILSHNLDALDVVAGVLVGVCVLVVELGLALAGGRVDCLPGLLDLIGILVVVLVVLVLLLVLFGGNALHVNKGLG